MRIFAFLVLIFGVTLAGGSVYYAQQFMDARLNGISPDRETVRILIAKHALGKGRELKVTDMLWMDWPTESVPDGAFTSLSALFGSAHDETRIVMRSIEPDEPILDARLSPPNESGRITYGLPPGMRAATFRIDDVTGVAGFVVAGDHVDIMLNRQQDGRLVNSVVLQDIRVLAVDQADDTEAQSPRVGHTATVEVSPKQAQKLALAQQVGRLSLTLRGFNSGDTEVMPPMDEEQLNDNPAPETKPGKTIRLRKGGVLQDPVQLP